MKPKIIAMYLPQFHQIPENDEFWGKGFTDWVSVKNAKPLFKGHKQPRVPLNQNYYDLSKKENVAWQAKLAKDYGVYGFGIYHYWFNNEKNLLTEPAKIILQNKDININYLYAWDNLSWKRSWSNVEGANDWAPIIDGEKPKGPAVLIPYILGTEQDWENHYQYLLPFFNDSRYIKNGNKPVFMIYHYSADIAKMCDYWNKRAKEDGFDGIFFIFRYDKELNIPESEYQFKYEPIFSGWATETILEKIIRKLMTKIRSNGGLKLVCDYDITWKRIIRNAKRMPNEHIFHGALVAFDDTPRRGAKARLFRNNTPEKFGKYLSKLIDICKQQDKEYIFVTAWNEWGESSYLEPDEENGYKYLKALKEALD